MSSALCMFSFAMLGIDPGLYIHIRQVLYNNDKGKPPDLFCGLFSFYLCVSVSVPVPVCVCVNV